MLSIVCNCDISKAFNRVWHRGFIAQARKYMSIRISSLLIPNLLERQKAACNSERTNLRSGICKNKVPQGCILDQLHASSHSVNDVVNRISSAIHSLRTKPAYTSSLVTRKQQLIR